MTGCRLIAETPCRSILRKGIFIWHTPGALQYMHNIIRTLHIGGSWEVPHLEVVGLRSSAVAKLRRALQMGFRAS